MSARRMLAHDLARSRDLESFRDGLPGLAARDRFRHKARKIAQFLRVTNAFSFGGTCFRTSPFCLATMEYLGRAEARPPEDNKMLASDF